MLQLILIITLGVPNPAQMERAYAHWLGYSVVSQGEISPQLASVWDAPRMAHRKYVLMQPASRANIYLRFIQVAAAPGYVPMRTVGWNAIESMVQDPDGLARRLGGKGSPFSILGKPRPLWPGSPIRAMQVVGPAKEVLYLTRVPGLSGQGTRATTYVDRPFVMVLGGTDLDALRRFYGDMGASVAGGTMQARLTVLNKAFGFDPETKHPIGMARVSDQYSLELDQYPQSAGVRPTRLGELPPAIAMVSFEVKSLDQVKAPLLAPAKAISSLPYEGRRVGVIKGPTGELIELIEHAK
jgi:catechol 2,3-dioxygenase-like lactoylglutathione lyase family enzyme